MLFEEIMVNHSEKEIISLCKKLIKKSSFTSSADATNLCELAYWLYVIGDKENSLKVCEYTNIEIPKKINYNVWDFLLWIWGLEAYIYNEDERSDDKTFRIEQMKRVWSTPKNSNETEEKAWAFAQKIMNRQTFETICKLKKIEEAENSGDEKAANDYRFTALYSMIGYGVTDFYPDLEKNKYELNEKIKEYIKCLR